MSTQNLRVKTPVQIIMADGSLGDTGIIIKADPGNDLYDVRFHDNRSVTWFRAKELKATGVTISR